MGKAVEVFAEAAIIAVVLTYLVLAGVLESLTEPLVIMSTLPMGLIGTRGSFSLRGDPLHFCAPRHRGKQRVLVIDACRKRRKAGDSIGKGILSVVPEFFRPLVVSTVAAVFGMIPMATGPGLAGEPGRGSASPRRGHPDVRRHDCSGHPPALPCGEPREKIAAGRQGDGGERRPLGEEGYIDFGVCALQVW